MRIREAIAESMITQLLQLCKKELDLEELPTIELVSNEPVVAGSAFGVFTNNKIYVVTKDRHPMDVMRTLAHELVHWKQRVSGQELDGETGSTTENDANAIAGVILRKFGQRYPDYFVSSMP